MPCMGSSSVTAELGELGANNIFHGVAGFLGQDVGQHGTGLGQSQLLKLGTVFSHENISEVTAR